MSILPPTSNTTIKETLVSTQNETAKATPGSQKRTDLLSDKMFDKDLCLWCLGPDENIKKKRKPIAVLFIDLNKKSHGDIFVHALLFEKIKKCEKEF